MQGTGVGLERPRTSRRAMLAAVIGQELVWRIGRRGAMWIAVDAVLGIVRPRFAIDDLGTVHTVGPAALRVTAGPSLRL